MIPQLGRMLRLSAAVTPVLILAGIGFADRPYYVKDLGILSGGTYLEPKAINDNGQVVGVADTNSGTLAAVLWQSNALSQLSLWSTGASGEALAINNAGRIAGWSGTTSDYSHATYWQGASKVDLNSLGGTMSRAIGINTDGKIVGFGYTSAYALHAFYYNGSTTTDLHSLVSGAGYYMSFASDINNNGLILAGGRQTPEIAASFVINTSNNSVTYLPGGTNQQTNGLALNDSGVVVGNLVSAGGDDRGFVWTGGASLTEIPTLGGSSSKAMAINNAGQVVGFADTISSRVAMVWQDGVIKDLNTLIKSGTGWQLSSAAGINEVGQIVGSGLLNIGGIDYQRGFLLTPARLGDADIDGDVDASDVAKWALNFTGELSGGPGAIKTWTQGDWDSDGDVDASDVAKWAINFTGELSGAGLTVDAQTAAPEVVALLASMGITVVPEPATMGLLSLGALGLIGRRRR